MECPYKSFAFNLIPNPAKYRSTDPNIQWESLLLCIFLHPNIRKTFDSFYFSPELTTNGNIHVHGYYEVIDKISYYRWFLPTCKSWGHVMVKKDPDDDWLAYVMKEGPDMEELFVNDELPTYIENTNQKTWNDLIRKKTLWMTQRQKTSKYGLKKIKYNIKSFFKT